MSGLCAPDMIFPPRDFTMLEHVQMIDMIGGSQLYVFGFNMF